MNFGKIQIAIFERRNKKAKKFQNNHLKNIKIWNKNK